MEERHNNATLNAEEQHETYLPLPGTDDDDDDTDLHYSGVRTAKEKCHDFL